MILFTYLLTYLFIYLPIYLFTYLFFFANDDLLYDFNSSVISLSNANVKNREVGELGVMALENSIAIFVLIFYFFFWVWLWMMHMLS